MATRWLYSSVGREGKEIVTSKEKKQNNDNDEQEVAQVTAQKMAPSLEVRGREEETMELAEIPPIGDEGIVEDFDLTRSHVRNLSMAQVLPTLSSGVPKRSILPIKG